MTALTLGLVAGLAVGSDGTERISTETHQRLAIEGYWEGTVQTVLKLADAPELITGDGGFEPGKYGDRSSQWMDEGNGRCQWTLQLAKNLHIYDTQLGIYKHEAGRLIICVRGNGAKGRPTAFSPSESDYVFTLRPVQPPKK